VSQDPHVWNNDGPDSLLYSLEGNYPCCTVNFGQGWPRYIHRMIHTPADGKGVAVSLLGPVSATLPDGAKINVTTEYPFGDDVSIAITSVPGSIGTYPVYVRIPDWATAATISVNGGAPVNVGSQNGTMYKVDLSAATGSAVTIVLATNPSIRVDYWYNDAAAVHRGALLYALQLDEAFTVVRSYQFNVKDYHVVQPTNTSITWHMGLAFDPANPGASMTFQRVGPVPAVPFSSLISSNVIMAKARVLNRWGYASDGSAAPPPQSPIDCNVNGACGPVVTVKLVPYGTTHLRITQMPHTALPAQAAAVTVAHLRGGAAPDA